MKMMIKKSVETITPNFDEKSFVVNSLRACADVTSVDKCERALVERSHRYACDESSVMMQVMRNLIKNTAESARASLA